MIVNSVLNNVIMIVIMIVISSYNAGLRAAA